jgi:type I restriction enzyme S subunit
MSFDVKPLGELCRLTMGRTPPRGNSKYWDPTRKTKNIWISIADMTKSSDGTLIDSKEYLSDEGSRTFPKVKLGTLLLSFKLSIGKLAIAGSDLQTNEAIVAMNDLNEDLILRDYLYYYLFGFDWSEALEGRFKVKGNTLNKKILEALPIKFPSLEKQHAVVEKLDSVFADLHLLEENLELSDVKANQLLQSILGGAFNANHVGVDLNLVPLKDFCKMYQPPTISTKEMIPDGEFVVYGANGPIGRYNKFNHEEPQLLITCRGATCGAVNMSEPFSWINGNAMVIQPDLAMASLDYMKYAFLGGVDVSSSITGSAQPQITRTTLEVINVPLPSLEKQLEIVEQLDRAFDEVASLKDRINFKKELTSGLRNSLLSTAFSLEEAVA